MVAAAAAFLAPASHAQQMYAGGLAARSLVTAPIDEKRFVVLGGNTHPAANATNDRGLVPDSFRLEQLQLVLRRPPELEQQLEQLIDEMGRPGSPVYHKWLTAQELGERFGPAQDDVARVTGWLESHGFTVEGVLPSGMAIVFSGNAGQVREAFHSEIHSLDVKGESHFANMSDPEIPEALAPIVRGVASLHNFMPHSMMKRANPQFDITTSSVPFWAVAPADLATIYNFNTAFSNNIIGTGQTIAVIGGTDIQNTSDVDTFRSEFGLNAAAYSGWSFTQVHPTGTDTCSDPGANGAEGEAALDVEWATAAAPNAAIVLASCTSTETTFGGFLALQNLLGETTPPKIVSISYGNCEADNGASANQAYVDTYQQAAGEGVSVFVAAGDEGPASCDYSAQYATQGIAVSGWASTPYNVAVGGTDFEDYYDSEKGGAPLTKYWSTTNNSTTLQSALSYIPEIAWNDSCASPLIYSTYSSDTEPYGSTGFCNSSNGKNGYLVDFGGSGGPSTFSKQPSWQGAYGVPTAPPTGSNTSPNPRYLPDVSLFAGSGVWYHFYVFCMTDTAQGGGPCSTTNATDIIDYDASGGTSFAAPIMAGIQALVNQAYGGPQGNPNPTYYALAATEYGSSGSSACNSSLGTSTSSACIFYDVTLGNTDVPCTGTDCYGSSGSGNSTVYGAMSQSTTTFEPTWPATSGWDFATGLGTVNVSNLIANWDGVLTTTSLSAPSPDQQNSLVIITATVASAVGQGIAGSVTWSANTGCAPSTLSSGKATCTTSALPPGSNTVTATYSGTAFAVGGPYFADSLGQTTVIINALITPTVTVTPTSSKITTAQALQVGVTVNGGSGNPTPTGTVVLSSGSYTSSPATLGGGGSVIIDIPGGSAGFTVPAGALAVGNDTLTATYTPDAGSSSTYSSATGTAPVTVSQAIGTCTTANPNPNPNPAVFAAVEDFNGDCRSDILWQNSSTQQVYEWLMNGTTIASSGSPYTPTSDWVIQGTGDFDGDGKSDILWRNTNSGEVYIWLMNGTTIESSGSPYTLADPTWVIQGVGDFDGDGKSDILWRNTTTGEVYIWLMNGITIKSSGSPYTLADSTWVIQGVGDFDGDGDADILWRNTSTGEVYIWLMNGTTIKSKGSPYTLSDSTWVIQGVGDFDGDGKSDILWRNTTTGEVYIWLMNGTTIASSGSPYTLADSTWVIQGTGDYDGSGRAGILWRNSTTEQVYIWLMNGTTLVSSGSPGTLAAPWQIANVSP